MHERFGRVGRWIQTWLSLLFRFAWHGLRIRKLAHWLLSAGRWLWRVVVRAWRFVGLVGLAERKLFFLLVWEPFLYLTSPFRKAFLWLWRLLGRMGLAWRSLLRFVWRPFWIPTSWFYRKLVRPVLAWFGRLFWSAISKRWQATAPKRAFYRRRLRSRNSMFRARLRVLLKRPKPPATAEFAPRLPRLPATSRRWMRIATVAISVSIVLVVSLVTLNDRQPTQAAGEGFLSDIIIIATPSPLPATPTLPPTPEVKLTPWPTPDPLTGGGTLAFTQRVQGNSDIYLLPVGQSDLIRLTSDPAEDREPAWSPDGKEIAFSSRRDGNWDIYVYNFPQARLRRITSALSFEGNPDWSPDGQWLVYESYQENGLDICIIKSDGSEGPYQITQNPAPDFSPVWSPGGRHVAYTSWRQGNKDIFLLSLDAANDGAAANVTNSRSVHEDEPAFSPDGRFLAYSASEAGLDLIYALPLAEDYAVTGPPVSLGQQGRFPDWSPDSQSLVVTHSQGDRDFLVAGRPDAWGIASPAFAAEGGLRGSSWSAIDLPPNLVADLGSIDPFNSSEPLFVETVAAAEGDGPPTKLWELPVSAPSPYLSDQVDQSFLALQAKVIEQAGWDLLGRLDGMFESLESRPQPGLSNENWNKAGRAFDLYYREALAFEPRLEVVRQELGSGTYWRVYARTAEQDGTQGEPLKELPWDFQSRYGSEPRYYDEGGKLKEAIPAGYYIDFTALAAEFGWTWVPSGENWRTYFPAIRFWHYENRQDLSWQEAMRQLYTAEELATPP